MKVSRRRFIQLLLTLPAGLNSIVSNATSADTLDVRNPSKSYGDSVFYAIFRKGKRIGEHSIRFSTEGNNTAVQIKSKIVVRVLKVPVYRFDYQSDEHWLNAELQAVTATVNDNGSKHKVSAKLGSSGMLTTDRNGNSAQSQVAFTSNHWNSQVLNANMLFNTLTGKTNQIALQKLGTDTLSINDQSVAANHYRYAGDLNTDVWYDDAGRWLQLRFKGDDGSTIEYRCNGFVV